MGSCANKVRSHEEVITYDKPPKPVYEQMNAKEWKNKIRKEREKHVHRLATNNNTVQTSDDYHLYIQYLSTPHRLSSSYSFISLIARITRQFIGDVNGSILYDNSNIDLSGHKLSIAIHPINGNIYIVDDYSIYLLKQQNKLESIATVPLCMRNSRNKEFRLEEVTFNQNGTILLCRRAGKEFRSGLYFVDYDNSEKKIDEKINCKFLYDMVQFGTHSVSYSKLTIRPSLSNLFNCNGVIIYAQKFVIDFYNQCLYLLQTSKLQIVSLSYLKAIEMLHEYQIQKNRNQPRKICNVKKQRESMDQSKLSETIQMREKEEISNLIERKKKEIMDMKSSNVETIDITELLGDDTYFLAFDVDKYYGAVYLITDKYMFYRIERIKFGDWKITHSASLREVLPGGVPLGLYAIKYDSVTGRIIIADNYKIQALYI